MSERADYLAGRTVGLKPALWSGFVAGVRQWTDSPEEWDQGAEGYARRYGSYYGRLVVQQGLKFGLEPVFKEDSRYMPSTKSGFLPRLSHALVSPFLARKPDGARRLALATLAAYAGAGYVAAQWCPPSHSTASYGLRATGLSIGFNMVGNAAREFSPELKRAFRRK